jgi:hypothetical protein
VKGRQSVGTLEHEVADRVWDVAIRPEQWLQRERWRGVPAWHQDIFRTKHEAAQLAAVALAQRLDGEQRGQRGSGRPRSG